MRRERERRLSLVIWEERSERERERGFSNSTACKERRERIFASRERIRCIEL